MASPLRHCALRPPRSSRPDYRHAPRIHKGTVEYVTFPTGRITGLQSADCIEMIEIQDGGERSRLVYGSRAVQSHVSTRATSQTRQDSGPHLTNVLLTKYIYLLRKTTPFVDNSGLEFHPSCTSLL